MIDKFNSFDTYFKCFEENKNYNEMSDINVKFDANVDLKLKSLIDPEIVINEIATVSQKVYYYNSVYESQKRVLQQIEDEYEAWYVKRYMEVDNELEQSSKSQPGARPIMVPIKRNETQKDMIIKSKWANEYEEHRNRMRNEKHKLGLLSSAKKSLESYSYKLSNINEFAKKFED